MSTLFFAPAFVATSLAGATPIAQSPSSATRYLVTEQPIDIGLSVGFCVAVEPGNPKGVWWWEPGATGCTSRSTGRAALPGEQAQVSSATAGKPITVSFRVGTHSKTRPYVDVRLTIAGDEIRLVGSDQRTPVKRRGDLDVPLVVRAALK